jgi:hypothetical protein
MPLIPTYESQGKLTQAKPGKELSPQMAGAQGAAMQEAGEKISAFGQKLDELRDFYQKTAGENRLLDGFMEINETAMSDPDIKNASKKAQSKMEKLKSEITATITSPKTQAEFENSYRWHAYSLMNKINTQLWNKQADSAAAELDTKIQKGLAAYGYANKDERVRIAGDLQDSISEVTSKGFMSREKGVNVWQNVQKEMRMGVVKADMSINPEETYKQLQRGLVPTEGKDGAYPDLTMGERIDLIDKADTRITQIKKQIERKQILDEFNQTSSVIKGIASNKINLNDPTLNIIDLAGKNTKLGIAIKAVQENKGDYLPEEAKNEYFQAYVKDVFSSRSIKDINNVLVDALNANGNNEISQDKLNILVDAAMNQAKILPIKEGDDRPEMTSQQAEAIAGVHFLTNWSEQSGIKDVHTISQYLTEINKGIQAKVAVDNAIKTTAIKNNPKILQVPEKGQLMIDKNGNKAMVFPDGHYEEVTDKGK